jgi:hypothetical protein
LRFCTVARCRLGRGLGRSAGISRGAGDGFTELGR